MNNKKIRKWILICELILAVIFIFAPVIRTRYYHEVTGAPEAVNGAIDLSGCVPSHKIILDGEWDFYWKQFIISDLKQEPKSDMMMMVPGNWSSYQLKGESLPSNGYASYRLILNHFSYEENVALYIPEYGGAYCVYIDGSLVAKSGTISQKNEMVHTTPSADLYPIRLTKASHEVVIEVATTRFSGLYIAPILCDYDQLMLSLDIRSAVRLILFGIAIFVFIGLVTFYIFWVRRKFYSIWMPLLVLFILFRMMLTTQFFSLWQSTLFLGISYENTNELMYFVSFAIKYLSIFLVQEQCGILFTKKENNGFLIYYAILYLLYILIPQSIYNNYFSVIIPAFTFVIDIYLFMKLYRERDKLNKYGMAVFLGEIFLVVGQAVNSFYINGRIYANISLSLMGFFTLFLIVMVWVYVMRAGDLYDDFTVSSSRLELAERQIAMQKEYYEALSRQMNEIREIRHDINHFTGTMLQLTEEGKFERLKSFLSEYCEKIKTEQLPLFCDHTICNSMIGYYYLRAKEYGIEFESRCNIPQQVTMSDSDLCIVLGNALDNAIFACRQMDQLNHSFITIEAGAMKGQLLIKIVNTYQGDLKCTEDGVYVSLKGGNSHGYGIKNMIKVIEAYGGFVKLEHTDEIFTFMAAVPE